VCIKQDQKREQGIQLPVSHTLVITISVMVSGRLCAMSRIEVFLHQACMNCMPMDSITEVFYHLNKMLIAAKHTADNNFVV